MIIYYILYRIFPCHNIFTIINKNTQSVLKWFQGIQNKYDYSFLSFDVNEFYPSISEDPKHISKVPCLSNSVHCSMISNDCYVLA